MKHLLPSCLLAFSLTQGMADEVIARAGSLEITAGDVSSSLARLSGDEKQALLADPTTLSHLVRSLAAQKLIVLEAREKSWDKRPEVIRQLEHTLDSALAESYLTSLSAPPQSYPSEAEITEAYETNRAAFFVPKSFRLAQIYIDIKPDEKLAEKKLAAVNALLKAEKADFAAIALEHSEEKNSAARGGELGWMADSQIQPEIRAQLPLMKLGAISEPFKLNDGWHILRVLDIKEASTLTLEQARPTLVQQLRAAKTKANSEAYLAELLKTHPVAINELALPKALNGK